MHLILSIWENSCHRIIEWFMLEWTLKDVLFQQTAVDRDNFH